MVPIRGSVLISGYVCPPTATQFGLPHGSIKARSKHATFSIADQRFGSVNIVLCTYN